jgi:hypothetical protein
MEPVLGPLMEEPLAGPLEEEPVPGWFIDPVPVSLVVPVSG